MSKESSASFLAPPSDTVLVTGGSGFIGSAFLLEVTSKFPSVRFINLDINTYAAIPLSLASLESAPNYVHECVDIRDSDAVRAVFGKHRPGIVFHFAAESHVDRSILSPKLFLETNVLGTFNILDACRHEWANDTKVRFHHVSTDEVFGSLGPEGKFTETTAYDPRSPYSASKAGSDHLVRAYHGTYGLPISITNCSNNYGPRQHPEKLIPLMIFNALNRKPLPVYGDGSNIRDWLYVGDHVNAIWRVATEGKTGETYNVGGEAERTNLSLLATLLDSVAAQTDADREELESLIKFVPDRPGHDHRYAIDITKINRDLGWLPSRTLEDGISETVDWYLSNTEWVEAARSQGYNEWVQTQYVQGGRS